MKLHLFILTSISFLISCKKEVKVTEDKTVNGVKVNAAVSAFNSFRTKGLSGHPAVAAVTWNDTLSQAAFNFAKAKTEDPNTASNIYFLSTGEFILNYPGILNYSRAANFALYYGFPANSDVESVITAGFESTDNTILDGLMSPNAKQFGMAQHGDKWFVIMAN